MGLKHHKNKKEKVTENNSEKEWRGFQKGKFGNVLILMQTANVFCEPNELIIILVITKSNPIIT